MESDQNIYRHINAVVQQMGMPDGNFVPTANAENRILLSKMQQLMEQRNHKNGLHAQLVERINWLQDHYNNSQNEVQQNSRLIDAHRKQFESEQHMCKLAENEHGATKKEFAELENEFGQLGERDRFVENETVKLNNAIDDLSSEMHWMKHALIEWMQAMEQGNQTIALIDKYCKNDLKRADALDMRRRKLQTDILRNATLLRELCDEQTTLEQTLDRTAHLYRQRHLDRRQMVDTWRDMVAAMNGRDNAIREAEEKILAAKQTTTDKVAELQMQIVFLKQQIGNNTEIELESNSFNDKVARKQHHLGQLNETFQLDSNELITFKQILRNQSEKLQQLRRKNRQTIVEREAKVEAINKLNTTCQELGEKLKKIINQTDSAQNRLKQLDELVEAEEKSLNCVEVELARLSQMLYRSKSILQQWQSEHKLVEMEIHVLETTIKSITANFLTQEKTLSKQMEMQHDVQFKILAVEMRIKNLSGKSTEVNPDLVKRLECMEKIFGIVSEKRDCVRKQLSYIENAERKLTNKLAESNAEHKHYNDLLKERQMKSESGVSCLQQRRSELRERLVEHSLLKMRLHQIQSMFEKQMGKFYDLAVHKSELQLAIDERMVDLRSQMKILTMKRKHLCDERSLLMADISERRTKIDALRARFELTNEMLGKNEDGTIISVVQLKIAMAQKKECLMQRGSELNESVIAAENDIKALENTLILVNSSNDQWRRNTLTNSAHEAETIKNIESLVDELANRVQKLKNIKLNIASISEQMKELHTEYVECENELINLSHQRFECNHALMQCHKHILEQKTKLKRAEHESRTSRKLMMQAIGDREYIRIYEKDLSVKVLEQKNKSALQQIADIVDGVRGLGPLIKKHLFDKGLQIPMSSTPVVLSAVASSKQSERSVATSLNQSRISSAFVGQESEYSFGVEKQKSDSSPLSSNSTAHSSASVSKKSTENSRRYVPPDFTGFSIDGQAIGTEKPSKQTKN